MARFLPYWHERIAPACAAGQAACSSRRTATACARSSSISTTCRDEAIVELNIPTGMPLVYELDDSLRPIRNYYLGDAEAIAAAKHAVANQGKARSN